VRCWQPGQPRFQGLSPNCSILDIANREAWMLNDRPDAAILLLEGFVASVANVWRVQIMSEWTLEELAKLQATRLRRIRLCQARNAPPATTETRIALVAFELGLSDSKLEQFYFVNRKGAKTPLRHRSLREKIWRRYPLNLGWRTVRPPSRAGAQADSEGNRPIWSAQEGGAA
jgi:hypothetical protein